MTKESDIVRRMLETLRESDDRNFKNLIRDGLLFLSKSFIREPDSYSPFPNGKEFFLRWKLNKGFQMDISWRWQSSDFEVEAAFFNGERSVQAIFDNRKHEEIISFVRLIENRYTNDVKSEATIDR